MKSFILIIVLIFTTKALCLDDQYDENARGGITKQRQAAIYFTTARQKHLNFDFEGAIEYYSKILELYPDADYVYVYRGNAKSALRNYSDAIDDYTKAIEINMDNDDAYFERGRARISAGYKNEGCNDLGTAEQFGNEDSKRYLTKFCN